MRALLDPATDLRYAARALTKSPGFTIAALLTLGLGIGASTAIFSVVDAVLLRPLPFHEPERLLMVTSSNAAKGIVSAELTAPDLADFRARRDLFAGLAAIRYTMLAVTGGGEPEMVEAARVSGDFFALLGVPQPGAGRTLLPSDDDVASAPVVVLSHGYWQRRFGGDVRAVGRSLTLDGTSYEIVGVLPESFLFSSVNALSATPELWVPLALVAEAAADRSDHVLLGVGRMQPGVSIAGVNAELAAVARRLAAEHSESNAGWSAGAKPLAAAFVGDAGRAVLVLFTGVVLLLLIAVANLGHLWLARLLARGREIAVRSALGASRGRLVRQIGAESLLLAAVGGAVGLAVAVAGVELLGGTDALRLTASGQLAVDARILAFTLAVTLATSLVFTLAGASRVSRAGAARALGDRSGGAPAGGARTRGALIVAEVALAVILLAAAGLIGRSFLALSRVHPGFDAAGAIALELPLHSSKYPEPEGRHEMFGQALTALRAVPGVTAVGAINQPPLGGSNSSASFLIQGAPAPRDGVPPAISWRAIDTGYFRVMRIPVLTGRGFTERDRSSSPGVVVVSRSAAERFWPGRDPVGQRIVFVGDDVAYEVVGVVGDVKDTSLGTDVRPVMYLPYTQADVPRLTFVVRGAGEPGALAPALRRAVHALDPDQPITNVMLLSELVGRSLGAARVRAALLATFAGAALLLASIGLYGVMAFGVRQRRQEIATRIALGARPADVVRMIVWQGMKLALLGIGIGGAVALVAGGMLEALLFGIAARDPGVFGAIALVLAAVALLASWLPAARAARLDPALVLRQE